LGMSDSGTSHFVVYVQHRTGANSQLQIDLPCIHTLFVSSCNRFGFAFDESLRWLTAFENCAISPHYQSGIKALSPPSHSQDSAPRHRQGGHLVFDQNTLVLALREQSFFHQSGALCKMLKTHSLRKSVL
jgi:hypothetical protein